MKRQRLIVKIDAPIRSIRWNLVNRLLCLTVDPQAMVKNPTPEADNARIARNRKSHLQLELPSSKRPPLEEDDVPRVRGSDWVFKLVDGDLQDDSKGVGYGCC